MLISNIHTYIHKKLLIFYPYCLSLVVCAGVVSGCSGSSNGSLSSNAPPPTDAPKLLSITPLTKTIALGAALNLEASGGTEPYSFDIYYGNGTVTTAGAIGTYQAPNFQGSAVVRAQDATGNTGYANIEIIDAPVIQPTSKTLAVNNKFPFAVLSGKAPYTFLVASGDGTINSTTGELTAGANAGAVVIRVTDADGRNAEANVTVNAALNFTTKTVYVEKSATYTLAASGGVAPYSYVLSSGAGSVDKASGIFTAPNSLGVSTVHVIDSLGNFDLAVINITTALSINPSTALIAKNGSLTFSAIGGVPPYTYAVQASGVGTIVSATGVYSAPTSTGSTTVRVTDSLGHTSDSTVSITNDLSFSVANIILAVGNTIDVSTVVNGGVAPLTYSVPSSQGLFSGSTYTAPNTPGAYTITVYDSQTPTANSVTTSVLVNSALVLLPATSTMSVSAQKSFSAAGGVPPYTYSVQSGGGSITEGLYTAPATSGSAVLLVTDVRGNTATTNVSIQSALAIVPSTKTLSAGESFTFTATGGNSPYTFSLLSGSGAINSSSGLYTAPSSSGLATVRVEDAAGNRKDALITILNPLSITPPAISLIKSGAITFTASGGAGPYSFSVASGEGSVNATTGVFTAPTVAGTSTVRVTDSLGSIKDATVTTYDGLTISPFTKSLALNQTFTFTAAGGVAPYTYFLVSGVGSISDVGAYTSSTSGSAIVRVTDASGNTSNATISVNSALAINPTSKTLSVNNQFSFSAAGGVPPYAFSVLSGNGTITTAGDYKAPATSTSAVIRVTDSSGSTADSTVTINDALTLSPATVTLAAGGTQSFIAAGGVGPYVYTVISGGGSFTNAIYTAPSIASGVSVAVIATDTLGNTANAVITIAPITVTISSPNSSDSITNTNKAAFAVSGTCSESSQTVSVTATDGTTTTTAATPTCTSGSWSTSLNLTSLNDTTITIMATHSNANGVAATPASVMLSKDGTAPTVASLTSSTPNGTYGIGSNISIQIAFSESVSVTGVPTLSLATGRSGAAATYTSGSNTNTLTFSYTIVSGDNSSDLDYSNTSALVVTAGTIKDNTGNDATLTLPTIGTSGSLSYNRNIIIDTTAPTSPAITGDGIWMTTTATSPNITFTAGTDSGGSGILQHQIQVVLGSNTATVLKTWADFNTSNTAVTGLTLTDATLYKVQMKAIDNAGNESSVVTSADGWTVDTTVPSTPGSVNDGTTSSTSSSPTLSWSASTDVSGIDYYEVAIGTSAGGTQVQTWTSVTNVTSATITGLTLSAGTTYYASVRAKDLAGNTSLVGQGDGWIVQASQSGTCPAGYILVPALTGYTTVDFCVAKYEMKNNSGAKSEAAGAPWVSIARGTDATTAGAAWKACKDLGAQYDLISNAQWQTIARNIADQATNWSTGTVYSGELSRGHSDSTPNNSLAASADNDGCNGTGQTCSNTTWDSQRRTHTLSNGNVIWDFAGNVFEWVKDNNSSSQGVDGYSSTFNGGDSRQINYGNDSFCASPSSTPYCGMGYGWTNYSAEAITRGGNWTYDVSTGIFSADLSVGPTYMGTHHGFRCVYAPNPSVPGFVDDGTMSSLTSSPTISWTASAATSGSITSYEVAIGTTAGGTQTKDWTSVGDVTSATLTGLSLTSGSTYYASARAVDSFGNISPAGLGDGFMAITSGTCPTGYIAVPPLAGYTTSPFCVAKYEMKNNSGAKSEVAGAPWVSIARGTDATTAGGAWKACKDLGAQYDLISNAQWQTIARNIADQATNWSTGTVYSGELSRGHSDNAPTNALAASTDNDGCNGTGQTCSNTTWDSQRRTHTLSNGNVIWDFAGNVWEWVKDNNSSVQGANDYASNFNGGDSRQTNYGNDTFCASPSTTPYCGMGYGWTNYSGGAISRGGRWNYNVDAGIFAANLGSGPTGTGANIGFRCVFSPE